MWLTNQLPQRFLLQPELAPGHWHLDFLRATHSVNNSRNTRGACLEWVNVAGSSCHVVHLAPPWLDRLKMVPLVPAVLRPGQLHRLVMQYFCAFTYILNAPHSTGPKTIFRAADST